MFTTRACLWTWGGADESVQHEAGEGDEVQPGQGPGQALVVAGRAGESARASEAALHGPSSPRRQHGHSRSAQGFSPFKRAARPGASSNQSAGGKPIARAIASIFS
jgi:hypothetical protein